MLVYLQINLALTYKLTDKVCLFFSDMTYVPGKFFLYICFASSHKLPFPRWSPTKFVGAISYELFIGSHSNLINVGSLAISDDLITFWKESIITKLLMADI